MSAAQPRGLGARSRAARPRGRPVLGAIAGFFLGLFVAVDLAMFKVTPLDTPTVIGLPILGLLVGLVLGLWPPFGRRRATAGMRSTTLPPAR